jgi:CBS domain-containing protein
MSVGKICSRIVVSAAPAESVRTGASRMAQHSVGTLVILDGEAPLQAVGIVTDRDIVTRCVAADLDPDRTTLSMIMTHPVRTVDANTSIEEGVREMARGITRRLVVTDGENRPIGILSLDDVLGLLIGDLGPLNTVLHRQGAHVPV